MTDDVRIAMLPHSRNVFFRVVNGEEILPSSADLFAGAGRFPTTIKVRRRK